MAETRLKVYDRLEAALEEILKNLPDVFEFEIDRSHYRCGEDFSAAVAKQRMWRAFEGKCHALGYSIRHDYVAREDRYLYALKRERKPEAKALPAAEPVIDV